MDFSFTGLITLAAGAAASVAVGAIQKHATKIPNNVIPFVNFGIGAAVGTISTGDIGAGLALGGAWSATGTGMHQAGKILKKEGADVLAGGLRRLFRVKG
jgi:hypothetical protein